MALVALACTRGDAGRGGPGPATTTLPVQTTPGEVSPSTPAPAPPAPAPSRVQLPRPLKAVWVHLFDDTLKTPAGMTRVLDTAASAGLNTVFVQVVRRHDAYYDSGALPPTPDPALAPGFDVLAAAIDGGHARGLQVHAWFTVATAWHEVY
jgi:uncharacterized lipoprotein YddW (UPF0748 family)